MPVYSFLFYHFSYKLNNLQNYVIHRTLCDYSIYIFALFNCPIYKSNN